MKSTSNVDRIFGNWLVHRSLSEESSRRSIFSIAIQSPCLVCQPRVALKLADYLNEFDCEYGGGSWLSITDHRFEQLQAHADFRRMLGHNRSDNPATAINFLGNQGGVILELPSCHAETAESANVFQVSMSCKEPEDHSHHLWLNAKRIPEKTLIPMIASAFFDWAGNGGDRQTPVPHTSTQP